MSMATKRLQKELVAITREPPPFIRAKPLESDILVWHYVIEGPPDSPYHGGHYHGVLKFPPTYPMAGPSVMMMTPSGRFATHTRLCLSMSDYHPESWNPTWSVASILTGLLSFMCEAERTAGSIETTEAEKRKLAAESLATNCKDATFSKLFPELVALQAQRAAGGGK